MLEAESVGNPGNRTFRLRASGERGSAFLWLEKEELYELALTVKRMLRSSVEPAAPPSVLAPEDSRADFDFKVARLSLGHDRGSGLYLVLAHVSEEEDDAVALWAEPNVLDGMADQAFAVHDAGRERCPLCGAAMPAGEEHSCPRAN